MRRPRMLAVGLTPLLLLAACSRTVDDGAIPSPAPSKSQLTTSPSVPTVSPSPTPAKPPTPPERWIAVSVATLWVKPAQTRTIDRPALANPADPRTWIESLTTADRRWLSGKLETQALYGTKVVVLATQGAWSKVAVAGQPTPRDRRGYPGWLPTRQLTTRSPAETGSIAVVRTPTTWVWRDARSIGRSSARLFEISYDTRLPVRAVASAAVDVVLLDGTVAAVRRGAVDVHRSGWRGTRPEIVPEASRFLGVKYLWGGTSGFAFDCSGLTHLVLDVLGVTIPRDASAQAMKGTAVARDHLQPGDLVFFRGEGGAVVHVAIYAGLRGGVPSVIHAPRTGSAVGFAPLSRWAASDYAGARRYL